MKKQGFTLIELMMVLAVIGILAVIAIPYYQSYTIRARVTEGLGLAASAQISVVDATASNGSLPANQGQTNYVSPSGTDNVASIVIGANGVITITFTAKASGGTILLTPTVGANGDISWDCTGGTLGSNYRPGVCR